MSKKHYFFAYFCIVVVLYFLVPLSYPNFTQHDLGLLWFTYQRPTFFVCLFCVTHSFFSYLSLVIPKEELVSIQVFTLLRQPKLISILWHSKMIFIPYFVLFILTKITAIFISPQPLTFVLIICESVSWFALFYFSLRMKNSISNYVLGLGVVTSTLANTLVFL